MAKTHPCYHCFWCMWYTYLVSSHGYNSYMHNLYLVTHGIIPYENDI